MSKKIGFITAAVALLIVGSLLGLGLTFAGGPRDQGPATTESAQPLQQELDKQGAAQLLAPQQELDEQAAVQRAIQFARSAGLQGDITQHGAARMSLNAYTALHGGKLGRDAASVGRAPEKAVWVVSMLGKVNLTLPGLPGPGSDRVFDNITVALDAVSGEVIGVAAIREGNKMLVPAR